MFYVIIGVGVVVVVAVTMLNRGKDASKGDPALDAARRVRDSVHLTDDGDAHGSFEKSGLPPSPSAPPPSEREAKDSSGAESFSPPPGGGTAAVGGRGESDLVWSGKGGRLEVGGVSIAGAMTYWSNGPAAVKEPCCIDVSLPVKFDAEGGLPEIQSSYQTMSPEQRGAYLHWLSRGRMGAVSPSYFRTWFFGIERRAMFEKKDAPLCLAEISARLPSLLENPSLTAILRFMTCLAVAMKYPTEKLALDLRCIASLPIEILNVLLSPYAGSEIRLPPLIAYTVMRNAFPGNDGVVLHNDEQMMLFTASYMENTDMGVSLARPKAMSFVAYFPTNPSLSGPKPLMSIETPDFFKDQSQFAPLLAIWEQVRNMRLNKPTQPPRKKRKLPEKKVPEEGAEISSNENALDEIPTSLDKEMRGEIDSFIEEKGEKTDESLILPLMELSELIELDIGEKPTGAQRRGLCEITRTGGRLLVPDLGISGKNYSWDDLTALVWVEIGERVSDDYRAAALLLEFASAFIGSRADRKKRIKDYRERITLHFELSENELERLDTLAKILEQQNVNAENLAGSFQNWIQPEEREVLRDFFFRLCAPSGEGHARERDDLITALSAHLEVEGRPQPIAKSSPLELGESLKTALVHLFRSEEV